MIEELVKVAMDNNGFGAVMKKTSDLSFFAKAMCWRTLSYDMCRACLESASKNCSSCLPSLEGRVLNSGCSVRYADYDFGSNPDAHRAKGTLLRS